MKPSQVIFEKLILKELHPHLDKVYAIKKNKAGDYVKYETAIAWEWYLTGALQNEILHGNRQQERTSGYIQAYGENRPSLSKRGVDA